jgi:hypothetical protein
LRRSPLSGDLFRIEALAFLDKARAGQSDMVITWGFPPNPACNAKIRDLDAATRAQLHGGDLDAVTHAALVEYHEQAASVDRCRARDSEEREVTALGNAITALRTAVNWQEYILSAALRRAETEHARLRDEYEHGYDEVHATDANLRNIQRSLEHQVRGLFTRVSQRFNEIRYRDGSHGGLLEFQITPPSPDVPRDTAPSERAAQVGWLLAVTPRWARRPPDGGVAEHVAYYEQANTAQYKLATVQLVLAALLANEDPIGRLLILDELGDGLGEIHRERSSTRASWP